MCLNSGSLFFHNHGSWRACQVAQVVKNPPVNAGDAGRRHGFIPRLGSYPRERNGNPLQYSCLENPTDRGTQWAAIHGVTENQAWLGNWAHTHGSWKSKIKVPADLVSSEAGGCLFMLSCGLFSVLLCSWCLCVQLSSPCGDTSQIRLRPKLNLDLGLPCLLSW